MKHITTLICTSIITLALASCGGNEQKTEAKPAPTPAAPVTQTAAVEQRVVLEPLNRHTNDGKPYFSIRYTKNGQVESAIEGDNARWFTGALNTILQLDSSKHLMVNGDALTIYLNGKKEGSYPVVLMNAGKDSGTLIMGFTQKEPARPGFSPDTGVVVIEKMANGVCSGYYQTGAKKDGDIYTLSGEFLNVKASN